MNNQALRRRLHIAGEKSEAMAKGRSMSPSISLSTMGCAGRPWGLKIYWGCDEVKLHALEPNNPCTEDMMKNIRKPKRLAGGDGVLLRQCRVGTTSVSTTFLTEGGCFGVRSGLKIADCMEVFSWSSGVPCGLSITSRRKTGTSSFSLRSTHWRQVTGNRTTGRRKQDQCASSFTGSAIGPGVRVVQLLVRHCDASRHRTHTTSDGAKLSWGARVCIIPVSWRLSRL
nr:hypothetical protein CFP56_65216 [Quercus suber]